MALSRNDDDQPMVPVPPMHPVPPPSGGSRMVVVPTLGAEPRPAARPAVASRPAPEVRPEIGTRRDGRRRWFKPENTTLDGGGDGEEPRVPGMGPAVGLCAVSTVLAGVVAYGTHPAWAQYPRGLDFILLARVLQWPFIVLSLIAAIVLAGTVIAGRRRIFWLIGLAPVLALFGHRFATDPTAAMSAVENPAFVSPDASGTFLSNEDYVLGITFEGKNYAYPFSALYSTPVVIHAQHDKRLLVMWSAPANRAVAYTVNRDVRARDLDVVSTPANALLVYDTARGAFINGLTGRTIAGQKPAGFVAAVPTVKMQWWKWRIMHLDTQVMVPTGRLAATAPRQPMAPDQPMPAVDAKFAADTRVVVIGAERPAAVLASSLGAAPLNLTADGVPVFVFREPDTGIVRGYRRQFDDLTPRFKASRDTNKKGVLFMDSDTSSGWNAAGVAVDAKKEFRGKKLAAVPVEDDVSLAVMKFWYPQLQLAGADRNGSAVIQINGAAKNPAAPGEAPEAAKASPPPPHIVPSTRRPAAARSTRQARSDPD